MSGELLTPVIGGYMARVFTGERVLLTPVLGPLERLLYRVMRTDPERVCDGCIDDHRLGLRRLPTRVGGDDGEAPGEQIQRRDSLPVPGS